MPQPQRSSVQADAVRRIQATRRARRGLVAGYIHALSARHVAGQPRPRPAAVVKAG